jgi:hypothetical protein
MHRRVLAAGRSGSWIVVIDNARYWFPVKIDGRGLYVTDRSGCVLRPLDSRL